MDRRRFLEFVAFGAASAPISWPALAQTRPDSLVIAAELNANSCDVQTVGANRATYGLGWMVYDRLIQFGVKTLADGGLSYDYFKLEPQLAESWTFAPDNTFVTFKLRKDAVFHDGAAVTAQDVKWSFDRMIKVGGFPQRQMEQGSLTDPSQFEALDDHTFKLTFLKQDKLTMPSLAIVVPAVYNSALCKKNTTDADPWALEWTKNNSAGSGAYKIDTFKPNEQVVLSRFDGWKGGPIPKIARAMYRNVGAAGTRRALVERGDVDMVPDLPPRDVTDILTSKKLKVDSTPMANTLKYVALSTIIKPFDDVRVRRAIAYAIPYSAIIENAMFGRAKPMFGAPATAPTDISWPQPFPYVYDPEKAKSLLTEAGLAAGFETKLVFDAQAASVDEPAALLIQDSLGKLGIKASIEKLADFFARRNQKAWPMAIDVFGAWFDNPDFFYRWLWHSQNTIWNLASYKNPEMDKLLDEARAERDGAQYATLAKKFMRLAMDDVPYVPLYQPTLDIVEQPDIHGYTYMFHRQIDARTVSKS